MLKKGPVTKLKEELIASQAELKETQSLLLRKAAEFDNARKRWEREREEIRNQAQADALRELCELWDNFERALNVKINDNEESFESYRKGVELIFAQFRDALSKRGVRPFSLLGQDFDPSKAEAIGHVETSDARPGQVIEELKKGFMFGEQILRPAQVIVAREIKERGEECAPEPKKEV